MSYEQLDRLADLRQRGVITEEEFQAEKAKLLNTSAPAPGSSSARFWGMEENTFCMLLHLAALANYVFPFGGMILQIVMWATNKDASANIDAHGKIVINWMISLFIYSFVSILLCFVLIGIPMLIALLICDLVFAIMGAVKANNGVTWRYPMSIRFLG